MRLALIRLMPGAALATVLATALPFISVAQTNFATLTTDGAWTWFNDPRALFHQGRLYHGYVSASDGKTALSVFDLSTGESTHLWDSGFTQLDDHNNPGLLVKDDGTMLAVYSRHISDQYFAYRTSSSTNPITAAGWNAEQTIPGSGAGMTYANPFQLSAEGGRIYNFCRNLNFNPAIYTSTDGGNNWSAPQLFIETGGGGVRPYLKYASDYDQRIDFLYTDGHPRDVNNSLYHFYYQGGSFYRTDGTFLKSYANLPILHDSGERGSVIYQYSGAAQSDPNEWIPTGRAWSWEVANNTNGNPVAVFTVQRDNVTGTGWDHDRIYYYYARWTGTNWQKRFIAHAGRPLYSAEDDYAGGICVDPVDPNVIYISSNAQDPLNLSDTTNVPLRANERYELWRGVTQDGGLTFNWTQVTTNSNADNLRPYVPRRNGGEPCVIWFRGTYSSYTAYSCSIVGLFTTDVPTPPPPPLINYLDATSGTGGNTHLAAGGTFDPTSSTSGTDGLWRTRTLGNNGTTFESAGDISGTGSAVNGNNEDAGRLVTTVTGLVPGGRYKLYAYFWSASGSQDWRIRASLTNEPGELPLFASSSEPIAGASDFTVAPLVTESDRSLYQAALGESVADGEGTIAVYIDDDPTARAGIANGWNYRSWYDGVGHAFVTATTPPNLIPEWDTDGNALNLSWPESHLGWILQGQTNPITAGVTAEWMDMVGTSNVTSIDLSFDPADPTVFFRLRHP